MSGGRQGLVGRHTDLTGRHILVVEDEVIVAFSLECEILDAGGEIVGPAHTLGEAFRLLDETIDAAVLDINIGGEKVWPLADRLIELGIPFLFASANCLDPERADTRYPHAPCFDKPVVMPQMLAEIAALAARGRETRAVPRTA